MGSPADRYVMRMVVPTDADGEYWGAFSGTFRVPEGSTIVAADWSTPGEVVLTYLIRGQHPLPE